MIGARWLGIDFSGNDAMWRPRCGRSNVWIADVRREPAGLVLARLDRVQELSGDERPFDRLAALLRSASYRAAAIDAPFSVPLAHAPPLGHRALLERVAALECESRSFPRGKLFADAITAARTPESAKPLRATERLWASRRVNVRSTLWAGARGGAPMTAACLLLLERARRPIWPWAPAAAEALVAEAFPAAQLLTWRLPHQKYDGKDGAPNRRAIASALAERLELGALREKMEASADALDAVLCAFAAIAVTEGRLASAPAEGAAEEGWIAVHE
jgi:hypothetical protein